MVAEPVTEVAAQPAADPVRDLRWSAVLHRLEDMNAAWPHPRVAASWVSQARDPRLIAFRAMWSDAVAELISAMAGTDRTLAERQAAGESETAAR
jgi:hypothetical protein